MNNTIKCEDGHLNIHLVHAYATTEDHSNNIPMKGSNAMLITVCVHDSTNRQHSTVDTVQSVLCMLYIIFWKISFTLTFSESVITITTLCNSNYFLNLVEIMGLTQGHMNTNITLYLLTPWCRVLLEKLTGLQLVKKLPAFHGTRRFITVLTSVRHLSLSWASPIQSIYPHPTSWRSILILSAHLCLGLLSGLFPSGFPTKTLYTPLSSPLNATCPAHLILLDFITRTILGEEYRSFSSPLRNLLHSPVTSSFLGPNILRNTLFSNTLSFLSSRNVSDQVSHPYKTKCPLHLPYFGQTWTILTDFRKRTSTIKTSRKFIHWYPSCSNPANRRTDRQTWRS